MTTVDLDRLFHPTSLAIIGASKDDQKGGGFLLRGLIRNSFQGKLYPVNPKESEVMGLKCYHSIAEIPGEVDMVVIALPSRVVPGLVAECGQKGVKFAVVHSAGFSEVGAEGKALENEVLRVARRYHTRILGPNCMGVYCPSVGLNTISPRTILDNTPGPVAFIGQSGWATGNFARMGLEYGLRFSGVASIGNQSDLTIEDFLNYFANDSATKVITAYIEGVKHGREFLRLVKQISLRKPVLIWKAGKTEAGALAAASHTGSLAGNSAVFAAAARQGGVASAQTLEELLDLAVGFMCPVLPHGNRVGILAEAAGGAVASADVAEKLGLELPPLSAETEQALAKAFQNVLPYTPSRRNPVDLVWVPIDIGAKIFLQAAPLILKDVDALVILTYVWFNDNEEVVSSLVRLRDEVKKPIIIISGWPSVQRQGMGLLAKNGIPAFSIPERGLKALSAMAGYVNYLNSRRNDNAGKQGGRA